MPVDKFGRNGDTVHAGINIAKINSYFSKERRR